MVEWSAGPGPLKYELVRGIQEWMQQQPTAIPYARFRNLERADHDDLLLLAMACGYKPDPRTRERLMRQFHMEHEKAEERRAPIWRPKLIEDKSGT